MFYRISHDFLFLSGHIMEERTRIFEQQSDNMVSLMISVSKSSVGIYGVYQYSTFEKN